VYAGVTKYGVTRLIRVTGSTGHPKKYFWDNKKLKVKVQHTGVGAEEFMEVLQEELQPDAEQIFSTAGVRDWVYLLDGASPHTAGDTVKFMRLNGINSIAGWPPYSPSAAAAAAAGNQEPFSFAALACRQFWLHAPAV
jgi:hypothetical protein